MNLGFTFATELQAADTCSTWALFSRDTINSATQAPHATIPIFLALIDRCQESYVAHYEEGSRVPLVGGHASQTMLSMNWKISA